MYFKDEFGLDIINIDVANKAQNVIIYVDRPICRNRSKNKNPKKNGSTFEFTQI